MKVQSSVWRVALAAGVLVLVGEATAAAQMVLPWTDRGYVHVNGGSQTKARSYTASGDQPLYDETATFESVLATGSGGLIDVGGGVRILGNLAFGVSFSQYSDDYSAQVDASIPDLVFFDRPHSSSVTVSGLSHKERAVHLSAAFMLPVSERLEVLVFGGPTVFSLTKDVVSGITVPSGSTSLSGASTSSVSASATGGHVGVDIGYIFLRRSNLGLGVGLVARQSFGSVDIAEVQGGKVDVGGFNYAAGLRLRF